MTAMPAPDPQDADTPRAPKGPLSWGLAAAALAGASLFLAFACPLLFVSGVAILAVAATVLGVSQRFADESDHRSEGRDATVAEMAACVDCPDRLPDDMPGRFQTLVAARERAGIHRIH